MSIAPENILERVLAEQPRRLERQSRMPRNRSSLSEVEYESSIWWLEPGREHCSSCGHTYVYETGYYCVVCDAGVCSICIEPTVHVSVFCFQCKDTQEA